MPNPYNLPRGIVKACAGIVADCTTESYITAIKQAERVIGTNYALTEPAQANRRKLIDMVKLNLANRDNFSRERLNIMFGIKITKDTLTDEKKRFCYELAKLIKLI